jgi:mono/diheme cytochrome c family protein
MNVRVIAIAGFLVAAGTGAAGQSAPAPDERTLELYRQTCQACHMADGNAALEPMNFTDGKWKHGTSVKELARVISDGVPGTAMMPFKSRFSEDEILALARYVRSFDKSLKPETASAAKKKPAGK